MKKSRRKITEKFKLCLAVLLTFAMLLSGPFGAVSVLAEAGEAGSGEQAGEGSPGGGAEGSGGMLIAPFSGPLKTTTPSAIEVKNYIEGIRDRVTVASLEEGDIVRIYPSQESIMPTGTGIAEAGQTSVTIDIDQLSKVYGEVYVTVTRPGYGESDKARATYLGEPIPWLIYGHTGNWGEDIDGTQGSKITPAPPVYPNGDDNPAGFQYNQHIIIKGNGERVTFYGYGKNAYKDFVLLPSDSAAKKTIEFNLDLSKVNYHSMEGAGILLNSKITAGKLYGHAILFTNGSIKLYKIEGVDVDASDSSTAFHNRTGTSGGGFTTFNNIGTLGLITDKKTATPATGSTHALKLEISSDKVTLIDNGEKKFDEVELDPISNAGNGFGFIASHIGHDCSVISYFTITNVSISDTDNNPYPWPLLDLSGIPGNGSAYLTYTPPVGAEVVVLQQSPD